MALWARPRAARSFSGNPPPGAARLSCTLEARRGGSEGVAVQGAQPSLRDIEPLCPGSFWKVPRARKKMLRPVHWSTTRTRPPQGWGGQGGLPGGGVSAGQHWCRSQAEGRAQPSRLRGSPGPCPEQSSRDTASRKTGRNLRRAEGLAGSLSRGPGRGWGVSVAAHCAPGRTSTRPPSVCPTLFVPLNVVFGPGVWPSLPGPCAGHRHSGRGGRPP